ncbi:PRC-barrel domain-containing protein [Taklimakanibacter lacteus]|uniref:PRC-barrel domain-containing protein n=1 Tax=Taklimakanibacter lacteus TaxID=2268456 RepID=UPI000E66440A
MKRFAIPAISLAALMASGVAFAQTTPDQQPAQEMQQKQDPATQAPVTPDPSQTGQSSEQPKDQDTAQQPTPSTESTMAVTVDATKAVLATSYIGSSVFTAANENVGDINDLIFDDKGMIQAAIIGVGGFLGMGEKDVALPIGKITVTRDETNAIKLTVQASREELERAPAFDRTLFLVKTPAPDTTTSQPTTPGGGSATQQ